MGLVIQQDSTGRNSMKRSIAIIGFVMLSAAFGLMAWQGKITDRMFITFPIGCLILYAPQLAITLLKIWTRQCVPVQTGTLPLATITPVSFDGTAGDI